MCIPPTWHTQLNSSLQLHRERMSWAINSLILPWDRVWDLGFAFFFQRCFYDLLWMKGLLLGRGRGEKWTELINTVRDLLKDLCETRVRSDEIWESQLCYWLTFSVYRWRQGGCFFGGGQGRVAFLFCLFWNFGFLLFLKWWRFAHLDVQMQSAIFSKINRG